MEINIDKYVVKQGKKIDLKKIETKAPEKSPKKKKLKAQIKEIVSRIDNNQNILYAENKQSLLIIFQGIDAAGKDSSIRAIMTGINPQGVEVHSFKTPSSSEYEYNYLWRHMIKTPEKGKIGVFNRSHYENVMACRVHPEYILNEKLPHIKTVKDINEDFFDQRYEQINKFEEFLNNTGTKVLKLFLNISKDEQKKRFIKRIEEKEKNWKFSSADLKERELWEEYQKAYALAFEKTSTAYSPWYIIPCDDKAYGQLIMAAIIEETLKKMNPQFPEVNKEEKEDLKNSYKLLKEEK